MADVITGDAVALELPVARFPNRIAALLIDMIVQIVLLITVVLVFSGSGNSVNNDYGIAAFIVSEILVLVGYPTILETATRGKTLGKMALGIRVIGDDGSPIRFRQALVRALFGIFEIWTVLLAPVALITSIISTSGKRVGDMFAGTYVIQERAPVRRPMPPEFTFVPAPLGDWAQLLQISSLTDQTAEAAASYLRRYGELNPQARDALGVQLANAVAAQVSPAPPAGTPPTAYLAAVLAVRRRREDARLAAAQPAQPTSPVPTPPAPAAAVPTPPARAAAVPAAPAPGTLDLPAPEPAAPADSRSSGLGPAGARPLAPPG